MQPGVAIAIAVSPSSEGSYPVPDIDEKFCSADFLLPFQLLLGCPGNDLSTVVKSVCPIAHFFLTGHTPRGRLLSTINLKGVCFDSSTRKHFEPDGN